VRRSPGAHWPEHRGASKDVARYDRRTEETGANVTAQVDVLTVGYADDRVASTVVLVRSGAAVIIVDPGMVATRDAILAPLRALGVEPHQVTDVVFSHHHPDHTLNAALFGEARFHDHWAIYQDDVWTERPADGFELAPDVRLMATPGHSAEDITTLITTDCGLVACTHLWWSADGPEIDPLATDQVLLVASRAALLDLGPVLVIPGHGSPYAPA
jgi:glyoxylase-like metal-dependent hydrolase (beta-lactamase superfamily II)